MISLARIQRLDLISQTLDAIHIPQGVYQEVVGQSQGRPGTELQNQTWVTVHPDPNTIPIEVSNLGRGEATAIGLALQLRADLLLIDDRQARTIAERLNLPCAGTLHLLQRAKQKGVIPLVRPILDALILAEFRISKATRQAFLLSQNE